MCSFWVQLITERESIAAVSTICRSLNWDFNVQAKDKSGIDAEIEVVNGIGEDLLAIWPKLGRVTISGDTTRMELGLISQ